jgi:hypothetical protein
MEVIITQFRTCQVSHHVEKTAMQPIYPGKTTPKVRIFTLDSTYVLDTGFPRFSTVVILRLSTLSPDSPSPRSSLLFPNPQNKDQLAIVRLFTVIVALSPDFWGNFPGLNGRFKTSMRSWRVKLVRAKYQSAIGVGNSHSPT